jgi:glycerol kinase
VVAWNKRTGQPLYRAIVWQCTRTSSLCDTLNKAYGHDFFQTKTGLPISTYFSAPKIQWLCANIPEITKGLTRQEVLVGTIDSWLLWWLTGGPQSGLHVTDTTNASRTQLMHIADLTWDEELLNIFNIPDTCLASIVPSSDSKRLGVTSKHSPFQTHIPICAALGDQQAALVGQLCLHEGQAKNTYGTGGFLLCNTGEKPIFSRHGLLTTLAYQFGQQPAKYCLEGSIAMAGALIQWFRDNLGLIDRVSDIEDLAAHVQDTDGLVLVPAFSGLLAPHWNFEARGLITGITRATTKHHMARAALEAIAFQTRDVVEAMNKEVSTPIMHLKVDGGMSSNSLLMQLQADILNLQISRPAFTETTALGAALAAGQACGFWPEIERLHFQQQPEMTWIPNLDAQQRNKKIDQWETALQRTVLSTK